MMKIKSQLIRNLELRGLVMAVRLLALTHLQRLMYLTMLSPREVSVMFVGLINSDTFDDRRSYAITHCFSQGEIADQWILARYEAFREVFLQPIESACRGFMDELRLVPCL